MRHIVRFLALFAVIGTLASMGSAQQEKKPTPPREDPGKPTSVEGFVARLMAFDKNKDGKLVKDEITEERLLRTFDRADANRDGVVTKEELTALASQESALRGEGGRGGPGEGGRGGRGGEGGRGGRGGEGGFGRAPVGQVLPPFVQESLRLTAEQRKQLEELQKDVDARMDKILTAEQKRQLRELRERGGKPGEGGRGGPGGRGGRPGEGGRPGGDKPMRP